MPPKLLLRPLKSPPEVKLEAERFSRRLLESELTMRKGSKDGEYPSLAHFVVGFAGDMSVVPPGIHGGQPDGTLSDKDMSILVVKMLAVTVQSDTIIQIMEAWRANQCHYCGTAFSSFQTKCLACNKERVQPKDNQFRKETFSVNVLSFDHDATENSRTVTKVVMNSHVVKRNSAGQVEEFIPDRIDGTKCITGKLFDFWSIYKEEAPHFVVNLPEVMKSLDIPCPEYLTTMASVLGLMSVKPSISLVTGQSFAEAVHNLRKFNPAKSEAELN